MKLINASMLDSYCCKEWFKRQFFEQMSLEQKLWHRLGLVFSDAKMIVKVNVKISAAFRLGREGNLTKGEGSVRLASLY